MTETILILQPIATELRDIIRNELPDGFALTFAETGLPIHDAAALPEDTLDALMLEQAADAQHAAGTCRMTAYEDPRGVVDPDLSVKGIAGLRVADASIMPEDCRANTHFTCVMIGLQAAARIAQAETA